MRSTSFAVLTGALISTLLMAGTVSAVAAPHASAPPAHSSTGSSVAVVVLLRDSLAATPASGATRAARAAEVTAEQNAVIARLAGPAPVSVRHHVVANAMSVVVTSGQAAMLALDPAVAAVSADVGPSAPDPSTPTAEETPTVPGSGSTPRSKAAAAPYAVPAAACTGTRTAPQLEPEGLSVVGARSDDPNTGTAASAGYDGTGVRVGYIADRVDPGDADFTRADGTSAIVEQKDFSGLAATAPTGGAEAFGDAGTIAAQGRVVHDLAGVVNPSAVSLPGGHCWVRIEGVAPGSDVLALSALDAGLSATLQAIDYAVTVGHVDVLNESFGLQLYPEGAARNIIVAANAAATAAGVTVVVASGDSGINGTIGTPAASPDVITVGATTHLRAHVQIGDNTQGVVGDGGWFDDQISGISSSGTTSSGRTVDLVAPGDGGWEPCSNDIATYTECANKRGGKQNSPFLFAGTSEAAPFTSGTAALVVQAYRMAHRGTNPTPRQVKAILTGSAHDLGAAPELQGAGRLDALAAVRTAAAWGRNGGHLDGSLVASPTAITLTGAPGSTPAATTVTVVNTGAVTRRVSPTLRSLLATGSTSSTFEMPQGADAPTFLDQSGDANTYVVRRVALPAGTDTAVLTVAGQSTAEASQSAGLQLRVFDPRGRLAQVSILQSRGTFVGQVTLTAPMPGVWSAVVFQPAGGTVTTGRLRVDRYGWHTTGTASPAAVMVAPGATAVFTVAPTLPTDAGTTAAAIDLGEAGSTIPVVLRSTLTPTSGAPATFATTLYGGNGRPVSPSQTDSWALDVPTGRTALTVDLAVSARSAALLSVLVDPAGQVRSTVGNADGNGRATGTLHQTVSAPVAGRWRLIMIVGPNVVRDQPTARVTGTVAVDTGRVQAPGLPNSRTTTLAVGRPVIVPVTVTNPGTAPMRVAVDAQRSTVATFALTPQRLIGGDTPTVALPQKPDQFPLQTLVPPGASLFTTTVTATTPFAPQVTTALGGLSWSGAATDGDTASQTVVRNPAPGFYTLGGVQSGPFGPTGAPAGSATFTTTATGPVFDSTVTNPTRGNYLQTVTNVDTKPVTVAPGASVTIPVTITPTATDAGQIVTGRLVVSTAIGLSDIGLLPWTEWTGGDILGYLPYTYRAGAAAGRP